MTIRRLAETSFISVQMTSDELVNICHESCLKMLAMYGKLLNKGCSGYKLQVEQLSNCFDTNNFRQLNSQNFVLMES